MENTVLSMRAEEARNKIRLYYSNAFRLDLISEYKQSHPRCLDKTAEAYADNVIRRKVNPEAKIILRYNKRVKTISQQHDTYYHQYSVAV